MVYFSVSMYPLRGHIQEYMFMMMLMSIFGFKADNKN